MFLVTNIKISRDLGVLLLLPSTSMIVGCTVFAHFIGVSQTFACLAQLATTFEPASVNTGSTQQVNVPVVG